MQIIEIKSCREQAFHLYQKDIDTASSTGKIPHKRFSNLPFSLFQTLKRIKTIDHTTPINEADGSILDIKINGGTVYAITFKCRFLNQSNIEASRKMGFDCRTCPFYISTQICFRRFEFMPVKRYNPGPGGVHIVIGIEYAKDYKQLYSDR